jgi:hypothetical protein
MSIHEQDETKNIWLYIAIVAVAAIVLVLVSKITEDNKPKPPIGPPSAEEEIYHKLQQKRIPSHQTLP